MSGQRCLLITKWLASTTRHDFSNFALSSGLRASSSLWASGSLGSVAFNLKRTNDSVSVRSVVVEGSRLQSNENVLLVAAA